MIIMKEDIDGFWNWVGETLLSTWEPFSNFISSNFALTIIGTFAAAFAGAYGAHHAIERSKVREEDLRELRATNAAIMVSFEITNSFLSIKNQHILKLYNDFIERQDEFDKFLQDRKDRKVSADVEFEIKADFQSINEMSMPDKVLQKLVFEEISPGSRAYTLTNTLIRTIDSFNRMTSQRNKMIDVWRHTPEKYHHDLPAFYFGMPSSEGHVDTSYPDLLGAMYSLTDDCIFFGMKLCSDLTEHGERLLKRMNDSTLNVNKPVFSKAEELGLLPNLENYKDWESMFVKHGDDSEEDS